MTYSIVEHFSWVAPNGTSFAIHCTPPVGSVRKSNGFRIARDGKIIFPSSLPFKTREEASAKIAGIGGN